MSSIEQDQTTISISKKNHQILSELGRKGQTFDEVLTEVLSKATEYPQEKKHRQPKVRVDRSEALAARIPNIRTALESDSVS